MRLQPRLHLWGLLRKSRPWLPSARASRRPSAWAALAVALAAFVLAQVALGVAVETVKPEWRDPEYGHRLKQVASGEFDGGATGNYKFLPSGDAVSPTMSIWGVKDSHWYYIDKIDASASQ